jgi:hypothetical protein
MKGLSSVLQFVKKNEHTNVIIMNVHHRFDSCVNKEVDTVNRKLNQIIKLNDRTSQT